jgi:hypothetical protein
MGRRRLRPDQWRRRQRHGAAQPQDGAFEVYDIANDALSSASSLGQVGRDWQIGGFAADPPPVSGTFADMSNDQLVQAMAGFTGGSGAGEGLNTAPLGADTSQQTLLTTPQHA